MVVVYKILISDKLQVTCLISLTGGGCSSVQFGCTGGGTLGVMRAGQHHESS